MFEQIGWSLVNLCEVAGLSITIGLVAIAIARLIGCAYEPLREKTALIGAFAAGLPLGFVGFVSGFLTGNSRAPAVGTVLPAILTIVGTLLVYLIGKGKLHSVIAGFAIVVFAANMITGTTLGTQSRSAFLAATAPDALLQGKRAALHEAILVHYRLKLGLPPYPPTRPSEKDRTSEASD